ncbi:putative Cniwi protein, partial [Ixodes scapularis]
VHLQNWVVMHTRRDGERTRGFTSMMSKVCPSMGIQVQPPIMRELPSDSTESYVRAIKEVLNQNVQVIVLIFPTSRDDRYSAVKRLCCVDMPVPSQVIISNTIGQQQKLRSVTQKVALQINCKLGGELWKVEIPMHNVMVIGIDVYHDITRGRQSVMGFVASMNQSLTRWFSKCAFQEPGKELVNCIKIAMLEAIVKYYEVNHKHPDRIFVFRDGVGDGQLSYVSDYEIEQLVQSFVNVSPDYKPSIAVVVVQKRINTRIFARLNGGRELDNPTPGTVVDHEVTRRDW